jgi:ribonuclease BN (tRNA processing enzyme)
MKQPIRVGLLLSAILALVPGARFAPRGTLLALPPQPASRTTVVVLGSGTPIPDPERSGPAVAVVIDSVAYLFDAGAGVVRRAAAAARDGLPALRSPRLGHLFLTHLHSDHTMGVNDVIFTPWIEGRQQPLDIYGPLGTARLVNGILDGNQEDIQERVASAGGPSAEGWKANVHEIAEGEVYRDARITVRAFEVPHSAWKHAFGYRITTPDRTIVLSGDARPNAAIARECNGCDLLIHEVYSNSGFSTLPAARKPYHAQAHTSATELGVIATAAHPRVLVLYHQLFFGATDAKLVEEVQSTFRGTVISSKDLGRY